MNIHVFYRGASNHLHRIAVTDVESHAQAIAMVEEEIKGEPFSKKPVLALIEGGK